MKSRQADLGYASSETDCYSISDSLNVTDPEMIHLKISKTFSTNCKLLTS